MNVGSGPPATPNAEEAPSQPLRRKSSKRKKDDEIDGESEAGGKRKRKEQPMNGSAAGTSKDCHRGGGSKSKRAVAEKEVLEPQMAAEVDVLESGFSVTVHYANSRRSQSSDEGARGEWRPGTVMRAYTSPLDEEPVYDIMMHSGVEEKAVQHNRCRMVCSQCLSDKRAFKPPPLFCEKCFTAIHTRWSYWEEAGDEGGIKLCKRCFSDLKTSSQPEKILADLSSNAHTTHRNKLNIDSFIEKKERDRPEYVDNWVQCDECHSWLHWTCALYKGEDTPEDCLFFCDNCRSSRGKVLPKELKVPGAAALPETVLSTRLETTLRKDLAALNITCEPVIIRVVSNIDCTSKISADQQHRSTSPAESQPKVANGKVTDRREFPYRSKCILAFQSCKGHEICFFAMYVQEYGSNCPPPNTNRVYISYLDSVRYFESSPEGHRTTVYHSILMNYLDYAKSLGFAHAHIWVSPPKQGDDYIFYAHPEVMLQKRMGLLKLKEWYEKMLDTAKKRQIIVDYQDMMDAYQHIEQWDEIPVFSGDHWAASIALKIQELKNKERELSKKKGGSTAVANGNSTTCAASSSAATGAIGGDSKQDSHLLTQITDEMRSMRNHFIVVTLLEHKKGQQRVDTIQIQDPVPVVSNEFVDQRSSFLEKCQMYHWQFDEVRNAQHSTLMLLYYLHGMAAVARKRLQASKPAVEPLPVPRAAVNSGGPPQDTGQRSRSSKIEMAMADWTQLLKYANDAAATETWELPPEDLFLRILAQINRSKRDILQEKYDQCRQATTSIQTRTVFIRVLKRIAESFMSCLNNMTTRGQA